MIEVSDLTKDYGTVKALRGVSFSIDRGQVVGLLGPNGAGKSTAMRILTGYLAQTSGSAKIDGQEVVDDPILSQRKIGYLPEGNPLYEEFRLSESLRFAAQLYGIDRAERPHAIGSAIEAAGLRGMERRTITTFSRGFRQRVGLAQALLHKPPILILDEPTSGLDPNQQEEMRKLIRTLGEDRTVVLSTHILPEVEAVCNRAIIINQGRVAADGTVAEIKTQARGRAAVRVTVRGELEKAQDAFHELPMVEGVDATVDPTDLELVNVRLRLTDAPTAGLLETVAAAAFQHALPLSELATERVSLERIFAELTEDMQESAAEARTEPAEATGANGNE